MIISTNQNVAALQTADGKLNYNNYYKDIGNSKKKLMRFAGAAMSVAGATGAVIGAGNSALGTATFLGSGFSNTKDLTKGVNQMTIGYAVNDAGNELYEAASKRFLATQATKDNLYILSEMPEGNGLLVFNKDKGEISKKITFSDTTPQYVVDEATDRLYVVVGNVIKAYGLK